MTSEATAQDVFLAAAAHADYWEEWQAKRSEQHQPRKRPTNLQKLSRKALTTALVLTMAALVGLFLMSLATTSKLG